MAQFAWFVQGHLEIGDHLKEWLTVNGYDGTAGGQHCWTFT